MIHEMPIQPAEGKHFDPFHNAQSESLWANISSDISAERRPEVKVAMNDSSFLTPVELGEGLINETRQYMDARFALRALEGLVKGTHKLQYVFEEPRKGPCGIKITRIDNDRC